MNGIQKDTAKTFILSLIGRSVGFFIPILIAYWFGSSQQTDAFFLGYGILLFISICMGGVSELVVVPHVASLRSQKKSVGFFTISILKCLLIPLIGLAIFVLLMLKPGLRLVTEFSDVTIDLVWVLVFKMMPIIFFSIFTETINGVFNARRFFAIGALSPAIRSLAVILVILFLKGSIGIHSVAWAYSIGELLRFLVSYGFFYNTILKEEQGEASSSVEHKAFLKSVFFQMIGLAFMSMIALVDQTMASWFGPGSVTVYTYAERLRNIPLILFSTTAGTVALSYWSNRATEVSAEALWKEIRKVIFFFFGAAVIFSFLLLLFRTPISSLVYQRGHFSKENIEEVALLLGFLSIGIPFMTMNVLGVRFLIIWKKNVAYMVFCVGMLMLNVGLNFLFIQFLGIYGIALSTACVEIIFCGMIYSYIRKMTKMELL